MKNDFKQIRRERDKFRDKFDIINEDFEEMKRQRDHYRQKLNRFNNEFDEHDRQTKFNQTGRSSPVLKHDHERYNEPWKKDSR
jgi:uncharacterized coiled-coil DUF342 family protein